MLELAAIAKPENRHLDGASLLPILLNNTDNIKRDLFWHFPIYLQRYTLNEGNRDRVFRTRPGSVIRSGKWKLHEYFEDGGFELYDLENDPGETTSLINQFPDTINILAKRLADWRNQVDAPVPIKVNPEYDEHYDIKMRNEGQ